MNSIDLKNRVLGAGHRIMTVVGAVAGFLVALGQYLELVPEEFRSSKWYAVAAALVALGAALRLPGQAAKDAAKIAGAAVLLFFAAPAFGQDVDPTTSTVDGATVAAAVAEMDFRGGYQLDFIRGKPWLLPAVAISPFAISLRDGKWSSGLVVGAGYQLMWNPNDPDFRSWGFAGYANMRSTADGPKPLVSLLAVKGKLGAGLGYQFGGGIASFRDAAMILISVGTNFGAATK